MGLDRESIKGNVAKFAFVELIESGYFWRPELRLNGVYCIRCSINGFLYVGSASGRAGLAHRFSIHISRLRNRRHHSQSLQRDWDLYGESAFTFDIIQYCKASECNDLEQRYLDLLGVGDENGSYNFCPRADSPAGTKQSLETVAKRASKLKGHKVSDETRVKLSKAFKGRKRGPMSPELKRKMSEAHKRRTIPQRQIEHIRQCALDMKGTEWSPDFREKLAGYHESMMKRYLVTSPEGKTYEVLGLNRFCREHGLNNGRMAQVAMGKEKSHKGWTVKPIE